MLKDRPWVKTILIALGIALGCFLFFSFVLRLILPFLIAFLIAFILKTPIAIISNRTGLGKRSVAAVFVLITVCFTGFVIFLTVSSLLSELQHFAYAFSQNSENYVSRFTGLIDSLSARFPFSFFQKDDLTSAVSAALTSMLSNITAKLPVFIANVIAMLPEILIFAVIIILASYYFCADYEKNVQNVASFIPEKLKTHLAVFKERLTRTGISYLRSCLILVVITYFELLVGFMMLGVPYAFTLALIISFVDMLPIFGVGTVLVPWALYCKLTGDNYLALGLLIIFITVTVVRRLIEPRIISENIGLSPLTTLFSMYIGFRLFGFTGLFFAPLVAILILHLLPENIAAAFGFKISKNTKN